jgi:hypothetical protein
MSYCLFLQSLQACNLLASFLRFASISKTTSQSWKNWWCSLLQRMVVCRKHSVPSMLYIMRWRWITEIQHSWRTLALIQVLPHGKQRPSLSCSLNLRKQKEKNWIAKVEGICWDREAKICSRHARYAEKQDAMHNQMENANVLLAIVLAQSSKQLPSFKKLRSYLVKWKLVSIWQLFGELGKWWKTSNWLLTVSWLLTCAYCMVLL